MSAPVPGKPNLHVALAMALGLSTQVSDKRMITEVERLKRVESEYTGAQLPERHAWACGCRSVGFGTEWVHTAIDPETGEQVFNACRSGHYIGQLFEAWRGNQRQPTHADYDRTQQAISDEQTYAEQSDAYRHSTEG